MRHVYVVTENFIRRREQRVFNNLFTPVQTFVAMLAGIGVPILGNINPWILIVAIPVGVLAFLGVTPSEGGFLYERWWAPIRVLMSPKRMKNFTAFDALGTPPTEMAPMVWSVGGDVMFAGEVTVRGKK